jgi:hypothetical protein
VPGVGAVLREGLGWTSLMSRSIYVTDGGQLENLGLVVALRRRPRTVYVFDASADLPDTFITLANAMSMARIDTGVEFEGPVLTPLLRDADGFSQSASATATIHYRGGGTGTLVYVKALATRRLPWDVEGYRRADGVFPQTGTEDQLYGEFDFEAFRRLGRVLTEEALRALPPQTPDAPDTPMPGAQRGPTPGPAVVDLRDSASPTNGTGTPEGAAPGSSSG